MKKINFLIHCIIKKFKKKKMKTKTLEKLPF
jgi:hypothetical protein